MVYPKSKYATRFRKNSLLLQMRRVAASDGGGGRQRRRRCRTHCLILAKWLIPWSFVMHIQWIFKLKKTFNDGFGFSVLQNENELIKPVRCYEKPLSFVNAVQRTFSHGHKSTTNTGRCCVFRARIASHRQPSAEHKRERWSSDTQIGWRICTNTIHALTHTPTNQILFVLVFDSVRTEKR